MKKLDSRALLSKGGDSTLLIVLIVFSVVLFTILKPAFFSMNSFSSIAKQAPEIGLFTMAMMLPMLVGGIDLSLIASANLGSIFMALYMASKGNTGSSVAVGMLICILTCVLVGFINGYVVAQFKIPAMLVTLGTQMALTGIALGITRGETLSGFPEAFKFIGNGKVAGIPTQFLIFVVATAALIILMQKTSFGTKLQMYGSNSVATQYSGVAEKPLLIKTYMLGGLFVGLAAIIMVSRLSSASAGAAGGYLMRTILIAVLGGVDPNGGKGKVSEVLLAILLFQIIATGLNVLRVNSYVVIALYGIILLLAVFIRIRRNK